jgi:small nuclear ribonucleoprotein E
MNLVIDDAVEVRLATKTEEEKRRPLGTNEMELRQKYKLIPSAGQILLKGDNVSLIQAV